MSWEPLNLAAPEFERLPKPPAFVGLVYRGRRHMLSGPPESMKTLVATIVVLEAIRVGVTVAYIDFENGPEAMRLMLGEIGASADEIRALIYYTPNTEPGENEIGALLEEGVGLLVIDSAAGAYNASGLDDGKRGDAERFSQLWIEPLWRAGVTTLVLDHVTKSSEARGRYAIGSERKVGAVDVHLGLEAIKPLVRGGDGLVKVSVHKDRLGLLRRPVAAEIAFASDPYTHAITWEARQAGEAAKALPFEPTRLMEKVSNHLAVQTEAVSKTRIADAVTGRREYVLLAVDRLIARGHATVETGDRGAQLVRFATPFQEGQSDQFPTGSRPVPGTGASPPVSPVPTGSPLTGEPELVNEGAGAAEKPTRSRNSGTGRDGHPLLGDEGYPLALADAARDGHVTEDEFELVLAIHRLAAQTETA